MVTKALIELHSIEDKASGSTIKFLMSFTINVSRVNTVHGNKKLFIRWSILLSVCVLMIQQTWGNLMMP